MSENALVTVSREEGPITYKHSLVVDEYWDPSDTGFGSVVHISRWDTDKGASKRPTPYSVKYTPYYGEAFWYTPDLGGDSYRDFLKAYAAHNKLTNEEAQRAAAKHFHNEAGIVCGDRATFCYAKVELFCDGNLLNTTYMSGIVFLLYEKQTAEELLQQVVEDYDMEREVAREVLDSLPSTIARLQEAYGHLLVHMGR